MKPTNEEEKKRQRQLIGSVLLFVGFVFQHLAIRHLPLPPFGPAYWAVHAANLGSIIYAYILLAPFIREEEQKKAEWKGQEKEELDAANAFIYGTSERPSETPFTR